MYTTQAATTATKAQHADTWYAISRDCLKTTPCNQKQKIIVGIVAKYTLTSNSNQKYIGLPNPQRNARSERHWWPCIVETKTVIDETFDEIRVSKPR